MPKKSLPWAQRGSSKAEVGVMDKGVIFTVTAAVLLSVVAAQAPKCGECDRSSCVDVGPCPAGRMPDLCGCCEVCARGLGQLCENDTQVVEYGTCGEHLVCRRRSDMGRNSNEATCECEDEGPVCGSDGVTYITLCNLLEETVKRPELFVSVRGPCKTVPVIKSRPKDAVRPRGGIMVLDCEATGYPVPEISWELNRLDGSSYKLPSDDSGIAVQFRGGPERYMVTGWVQIMRITEKSIGTYTCVATNSEGEERASATISFIKSGENEQKLNEV